MARPPIVISNGGIAEALTVDLEPKAGVNKSAEEIILENVEKLNARQPGNNPPVAKSLFGRNRNNDPRIYWRLELEDEYQEKHTGSEIRELGIEAQ